MIVIADTTPLITLLKINHLDILKSLYNTVHIPLAVYHELTQNIDFPDEADAIKNCTFLIVHEDVPADRVDLLCRATGLDLGEGEAIILADSTSETEKILLIDETHARAVAEQMGIQITGVIGVLMAAYKKKLLSAAQIKESVEIMRMSNRFISDSLYKLLLSLLEQ